MTEKELHRISKSDLLKLLLAQSKELSELRESLSMAESGRAEYESLSKQLQEKLNSRDDQISSLMSMLNDKEKQMDILFRQLEEKSTQIWYMKARIRSMQEHTAGSSSQTVEDTDIK